MSELTKSIGKPVGIAIGVLLVGGVVWWLLRDKLAAIGTALNPTSDRNLAYRGVNAIGAALSGTKEFSLGSWLYDNFDKRAYVEREMARREQEKLAAPRGAPPDERAWYEQLFTRGG